MAHSKPQDISHEMRSHRRMQVVYGRKTQERQIFMEDLKGYRKRKDKTLMKEIRTSMGTRWYQVLSVLQLRALDTLEISIYQDLLEARPTRTQKIMKALGIIPRTSTDDMMHCIYLGRNDPKQMLAQLFLLRYNHSFDIKQDRYDLNARLLLSAILYLGMPQLISLLRDQFQPDEPEPPPPPPKKPKPGPPLASPYLEKMIAVLYEPKQWVRKPPPPLPNLEKLNEPIEPTPPIIKPPPPPPPPPPPKKRLPVSYCDKLAGINPIEAYSSVTGLEKGVYHRQSQPARKLRVRRSKYITEEKKVYGIGNTRQNTVIRRRKPKAPTTGIPNAQYTICGVAKVKGKVVFLLGNVSILPASGDIIHGGHALVGDNYINIYNGIRGHAPPPKSLSCDCVKQWTNSVFRYIKNTKCYCGHHYDFYNEGTYPPDEMQYFEKPTRYGGLQMKYDNIYDIDEKQIHVAKTFKKLWETDSIIHIDDDDEAKQMKSKPKKKRSSKTCLGVEPKLQDYLKCALYRYRHINIASRLPDIYLVPELVDWMRKRLHGPYTREQKKRMNYKSNVYWTFYKRFALQGIPHVPVPKVDKFGATVTTWTHKQSLNDDFRKFIHRYRLAMFKSHAAFNNMMWPSMFQAQVPDKKFREIYFSYLFGTLDNLTCMHPYNSIETQQRYETCLTRPYRCPPPGVENINMF